MLLSEQLLIQSFTDTPGMVLMFVYLLIAGGLLYGSAAFAGSQAYVLAGLALAVWLAVLGARSAWRAAGGAGNR